MMFIGGTYSIWDFEWTIAVLRREVTFSGEFFTEVFDSKSLWTDQNLAELANDGVTDYRLR
jgi:hypothetical protein